MLKQIKQDLQRLKNPEKAKLYQGYFKTGKGEYGEGDVFLGISMPDQRRVAKNYKDAKLNDITALLKSRIHEHRQVALIILVERFQRADEKEKRQIASFYLKNTQHINNWDLVDISAHKILGAHLFDKDRKVLYTLARSKSLWERRISVLATFYFINENDFNDALSIAELLLEDEHDLIHKAVGWMLREVGNRSLKAEEKFLKKNHKVMPRTMLRYAIEKFPEKKRRFYMQK